ncbi:MAG: hypothetical protein QG608_2186 [Actinomycetota bacterium]|nr:hypothetical protein [Actinomycetota bacterium]
MMVVSRRRDDAGARPWSALRRVVCGISVACLLQGCGVGGEDDFAGLCGTVDLGRIRDARRAVLGSQPGKDSRTYECADNSDEPYVAAATSRSFDCAWAAEDFSRFFAQPPTSPAAGEENHNSHYGDYVEKKGNRIYLSCNPGELTVAMTPLSVIQKISAHEKKSPRRYHGPGPDTADPPLTAP